VITFLSPGLRFFHQGQFEGRRKRISPHLVRAPLEPVDEGLQSFYVRLLSVLGHPALREGDWRLLECGPAWDGNWTWDCFLAFAWRGLSGDLLLVAVNYAPTRASVTSGCVRGPLRALAAIPGSARFRRLQPGTEATSYRAASISIMPPWGYHLFEVK